MQSNSTETNCITLFGNAPAIPHEHQFEKTSTRLAPNPLLGLFERYATIKCCGRRCERVKEIAIFRCRECDATKEERWRNMAFCHVCSGTTVVGLYIEED